jgi:geranylgeranyl diphosphate synthase type II
VTTLPESPLQALDATLAANSSSRKRRKSTSHLKFVPENRELREKLRVHCSELVAQLDKRELLSKDDWERLSRELLSSQGLTEEYLGWTMVVLTSEFWRDQVAAIPPQRRLLLLPHCLKHAEGCPADYDEFGLDCRRCGACSIADFRTQAEDMGYRVLVAEGSPIVLKIIVSGYVDAILGVACLNVLEKAIDKILLAGIPCMAVPLLSSDCRNTSVDEDWVNEMILVRHEKPIQKTQTYLHLLRAAKGLFDPVELAKVVPRLRSDGQPVDGSDESSATLDPIAGTEILSHDLLARGGKYSRPFITLAAYDAMSGGACTQSDGADHAAGLPISVRRVAVSIESFHKASLVHDDIQDDDAFRYGQSTLHRDRGVPTAINVGDYLIGLGYRLVATDAQELGSEVAADILARLSDAHTRLSEGQGAELLWRDGDNKRLTPLDALKIYALKTAPAFEVAMLCGVRLAGPTAPYDRPLKQLAKHLGIAFQILNDLQDWNGDDHNKLVAGADALGGRPTILWALAIEALDEPKRLELEELANSDQPSTTLLPCLQALYQEANVFEKADRLVDKYRERAEQIADDLDPIELRRLAFYIIDTVLDRPEQSEPPVVPLVNVPVISSLS